MEGKPKVEDTQKLTREPGQKSGNGNRKDTFLRERVKYRRYVESDFQAVFEK